MEKIVLPFGNGVGISEGSKLCVSMLDNVGDKKVGGKVLKSIKKFWSFPFIRGLTFFFRGIA